MFVHWAPPNERMRLITIPSNGFVFGLATVFPISGFLIQNYGWQNLFYICGKLHDFLPAPTNYYNTEMKKKGEELDGTADV